MKYPVGRSVSSGPGVPPRAFSNFLSGLSHHGACPFLHGMDRTDSFCYSLATEFHRVGAAGRISRLTLDGDLRAW